MGSRKSQAEAGAGVTPPARANAGPDASGTAWPTSSPRLAGCAHFSPHSTRGAALVAWLSATCLTGLQLREGGGEPAGVSSCVLLGVGWEPGPVWAVIRDPLGWTGLPRIAGGGGRGQLLLSAAVHGTEWSEAPDLGQQGNTGYLGQGGERWGTGSTGEMSPGESPRGNGVEIQS